MIYEDAPPRAEQGATLMMELVRFHEAHRIYESAPDAEKEMHYARRHAALMLVLGSKPTAPDDLREVMRIALEELAKDLMHEGPLPDAVRACLGNCYRGIASLKSPTPAALARSTSTASALSMEADAPPQVWIDMESELAKLENFTGLLGYLGRSSAGKLEEGLFLALKHQIETIKDSLSAALHQVHAGNRRRQ